MLEWLERAYAERDVWLVWLKVDPRLDGLRAELRFKNLLWRVFLDSGAALPFTKAAPEATESCDWL